MKYSNKEQKQIQTQKLSPKQKIRFRLIVAGSSAIALTVILLIYINLQKTEEMKANSTVSEISIDRPVDLIVPQVKLKQDSASLRTTNYKIAKPLNAPSSVQN